MKRVIILLIMAVAFCGCSVVEYEPAPEFDSIEDLLLWVSVFIKYTSDGYFDNWQTPEETLDLRSGDCEDKAALFLFLSGDEGNLIAVQKPGYNAHMIVEIDSIYYDPTINTKYQKIPNDYTVLSVRDLDLYRIECVFR
jgi:hypothetical protein